MGATSSGLAARYGVRALALGTGPVASLQQGTTGAEDDRAPLWEGRRNTAPVYGTTGVSTKNAEPEEPTPCTDS